MSETTTDPVYEGGCYCGAVKIAAAGAPKAQAYCHCRSCRAWQGAPINAWTIWKEAAVTFSGGPLTRSHASDASERLSCAACGGAVGNRKPQVGMVVLYAAQMAEAGLPFEPGFHIHYGERVMDVADGLPKYVSTPSFYGGDGVEAPEPGKTSWLKA